ncbi:hypothetical protein EVG20_g7808 [Dentipellis fragilis]|uniref:C2H2-type domain-containing protein n=1 Tax=Dentipellis fragilis TaxID=205917 RepID=A0A4Y9YA68_9AGAM|nr:hypothetical protein EVG20_g7808 [Dentipellis fragilis]
MDLLDDLSLLLDSANAADVSGVAVTAFEAGVLQPLTLPRFGRVMVFSNVPIVPIPIDAAEGTEVDSGAVIMEVEEHSRSQREDGGEDPSARDPAPVTPATVVTVSDSPRSAHEDACADVGARHDYDRATPESVDGGTGGTLLPIPRRRRHLLRVRRRRALFSRRLVVAVRAVVDGARGRGTCSAARIRASTRDVANISRGRSTCGGICSRCTRSNAVRAVSSFVQRGMMRDAESARSAAHRCDFPDCTKAFSRRDHLALHQKSHSSTHYHYALLLSMFVFMSLLDLNVTYHSLSSTLISEHPACITPEIKGTSYIRLFEGTKRKDSRSPADIMKLKIEHVTTSRPVLHDRARETRADVLPAPLGSLPFEVCEIAPKNTSHNAHCEHEIWLILDMDDARWSGYSKYTLRISWPASSPADFLIDLYTPSALASRLHPIAHPKLPSSSTLTRRQYARIRLVDTGVRPPSPQPHPVPHVPFIVRLEPLLLGFLPASVAPILAFLVPVVGAATMLLPYIQRRVENAARRAREEIRVSGHGKD